MLATSAPTATDNIHIEALRTQLGGNTAAATGTSLVVVSDNPGLDLTLVSRLRDSGALVLRSTHEALSKSLESEAVTDAIVWAVAEAGVTSLTLVGHSQAATIPMENLGKPLGLLERVQLVGERVQASKLKLKDDFARFASHQQIKPMLTNGSLTIHALFYLRESGSFLMYDIESDDFAPLGKTTSH